MTKRETPTITKKEHTKNRSDILQNFLNIRKLESSTYKRKASSSWALGARYHRRASSVQQRNEQWARAASDAARERAGARWRATIRLPSWRPQLGGSWRQCPIWRNEKCPWKTIVLENYSKHRECVLEPVGCLTRLEKRLPELRLKPWYLQASIERLKRYRERERERERERKGALKSLDFEPFWASRPSSVLTSWRVRFHTRL